MGSLKNNKLLWWTFGAAASFWIIAPFIPNPYLSSLLSLCLLGSACMTFYQYSQPAYRILFLQQRAKDELGRGQGSHLAVLGVFLFALGSAAMGVYGLAWNFRGQPPDWIGSAPSQFGRACHIAAFCLMQISPQITTDGIQIKGRWWVLFVASAIMICVGFYFGLQVRIIETDDALRSMESHIQKDLPTCPIDRPVWGSSSRVYHMPDSPYRLLVIPIRCFSGAAEAESAGFRHHQ